MVEVFSDCSLDLVSRLEMLSPVDGVRPSLDGAAFACPAEFENQGIAEPLTAAIHDGVNRSDLHRFGQDLSRAIAQALAIAHRSKSEWSLSVDLRLIITTLLPRSL